MTDDERVADAEARPIDGHELLERLATLPVATWRHHWEPPEVQHLGPMSQDFRAAFGLGDDERRIDMVDANGVLTVAVQALVRRVAALEAEFAALREQLQGEGHEGGAGREQGGSATNDERREEPDTEDAEGQGWRTPVAPDEDGDDVAGHVQYRPPTEDGISGRSGFDKAPLAHDDEP